MPNCLECRRHFRGMVAIVVHQCDRAARREYITELLQAAINPLKLGQRAHNGCVLNLQLRGNGNGRQSIQDVMPARQIQCHVQRRISRTQHAEVRLQPTPLDIHSLIVRVAIDAVSNKRPRKRFPNAL